MKKTLADLREKKVRGEAITVLTAYDYPTARLEDEAGVDVILVGDSVGTNVLGYESEKQVTMEDIIHHLRAVRRGVQAAYLLVDLPYRSYETPAQALSNSQVLLSHGADGVKMEGVRPDIVRHLAGQDIAVCSHLGYTPQTEENAGLRAKTAAAAARLIADARRMEQAGAAWILFEMIPEEVARRATQSLTVPTIGIGAGRFTDGQVLVVLDMLGYSPVDFRHNKRYERFRARASDAIRAYLEEVRARRFPGEQNARRLPEEELGEFLRLLEQDALSAREAAHKRGTPKAPE